MRALLFAVSILLLAGSGAGAEDSLVLVTLDTYRGDFLSALGSERVATPNLDRLAEGGVLFTRARAPVPLTLPSHASLLTGLYPPEHGVRDNGQSLGEEPPTLAERLREGGYRTAAFVASFVLDGRFGLARGFEHYDDAIAATAETLESPEAERSGDEVLQSFVAWLDTLPAKVPFFAWVHFYEPHAPYEPPEPFKSRYPDEPYAGEVAYTDALVGRLLEALESRKLLSSTLVAIAGDHGEGLGEHEEATHSLLVYNSTLDVPLIVAGSDLPRDRRVGALVRTIDLGSTLLDYLGFEGSLGRGSSLRPLIENRAEDEEPRTAYSESLYGFYHLGWSPLYGLETEGHRFVDAPSKELYDVLSDPGETTNVLEQKRSTSRELFRRLGELRSALGADSRSSSKLDAETRAKLESLGYLTATARPKAAKDLPDPKANMETYHRIQRAQFQRSRGDSRGVVESLSPLSEDAIPLVVATLARCLIELDRLEAARALLRDALAQGLESARFHVDLGVIAYRQGRLDEAERELEVALALDETSVVARYHLANVYRAAGRNREAIAAYREAIAINPRYVFAWNGLGMTFARIGENGEALEAFRKAVGLEAREPRGWFNLAVQLERMGRDGEALGNYRRFLEQAGDDQRFRRERERARAAVERLSGSSR